MKSLSGGELGLRVLVAYACSTRRALWLQSLLLAICCDAVEVELHLDVGH
jgi:hypothetical protein